jgi:hypothetical protein
MSKKPLNLVFLALSIPFLVGAVFGCNAQPSAETGGPEALIEAWVEMWNSYDLDQVDALFLDDDRLSYFSSEKEGLIRGMEAVREHHVGFGFVPGGMDQPNRLWLEDLSTDLFLDAAVVTGIWYFESGPEEPEEGEPEPIASEGAETSPQKGPVTFVCVNQNGRWRFVHMSFSDYLPIDGG